MSGELVVDSLTDTLTIITDGLDEAVSTVVVQDTTVDTIDLATDVLTGLGPKGDKGDSPSVSRYDQANVAIQSGVLTINAAAASTVWVNMNQDVTSVVVENWANTQAQRIHVYAQQDGVGNHTWSGWPTGTRWSYGIQPFETAPGAIESFVLEHLPVGNLVFGAIVGRDYA